LENAERKLPYIQQSKNVTLSNPRLLYRLIVSEKLRDFFGHGPVNTDNWPQLEFAAPKLMYRTDPAIIRRIQSQKRLRPETKNIIRQITTNIDDQIDFATYALSVHAPFPCMVELSKATRLQKERFFELMETYCGNNHIDFAILKDAELKRRCRAIQIKTIQKRTEHARNDVSSYLRLAVLCRKDGKIYDAIVNCSKMLKIEPDNVLAHSLLGELLIEQNNFEEATKHFNEALRIKPDFLEAHVSLGVILLRQGKLDEAFKHYTKALEINPYLTSAHINLGVILVRQGKLNEAIKHYANAVRIDPNSVEAHSNLGSVLLRQGKLDEAIKHFTEALRIKPNLFEAHSNLGSVLLRQGKLDKAIEHYTEAVRIKPNSSKVHYNLGLALAKQDNFGEAVTHFTEALRIKPDFTDAQKALKKALALQNERPKVPF